MKIHKFMSDFLTDTNQKTSNSCEAHYYLLVLHLEP